MYVEQKNQEDFKLQDEAHIDPRRNGRRLVVLSCLAFWAFVAAYLFT